MRRASHLLAIAVCAGALAVALVSTRSRQPLIPDAAHNAVVARNLARGNGFRIDFIQYHVGGFGDVEHVAEMHGILQPLLLAGLFAVLGEERSLVRVPGVLYVALTGWLAFLYARRLFGDAAGLAACALTLSSSALWTWAWYGVDDSGFAFWFLLAVFALDVALERRSAHGFLLAGLAAAGALLQKLTGLILLAPWLAIQAFGGPQPRRTRAHWAAVWLAPWAAVLALYLARNLAASGSVMFRFGPIDWIYKARGLEAFFAVHDQLPTLPGVLSSIGLARVVEIIAGQLADFARTVLSPAPWMAGDPFRNLTGPPFLAPLGIASLAVVARAAPRFASITLLALVAAVAFICGIWHFELRFFTMLVPLLAISTAGALAVTARSARARLGRGPAAAVGALGVALVALAVTVLASWPPTTRVASGHHVCAGSLDWIRRETLPADRILTFDPWTTAWATERPAIVVPSGARRDVERVIARWGPRWLVVRPMPGRGSSLRTVRAMLAKPTRRFAAQPVFSDGDCDVYRITSGRGARR